VATTECDVRTFRDGEKHLSQVPALHLLLADYLQRIDGKAGIHLQRVRIEGDLRFGASLERGSGKSSSLAVDMELTSLRVFRPNLIGAGFASHNSEGQA
jgi:hypothetical protein